MKKRMLCWLLVLVMVVSLLPTFAAAEETAAPTQVGATISAEDKNLHLDKTLYSNSDGTYDIRLESYATGRVETEQVTESVPTDFVLVLDQSGSMAYEDMATGYDPAGRTSWKPEDFLQVTISNPGGHGGSTMSVTAPEYYYKTADGKYFRAYYKDKPTDTFNAITNEKIRSFTEYENFVTQNFLWSERSYDYADTDGPWYNFAPFASQRFAPVYYLDETGAYHRVYGLSVPLLARYHTTLFYIDSLGERHDLGTWSYSSGPISGLMNNNTVPIKLYTDKWYKTSGIGGYGWTEYNQKTHGYKLYYTDDAGNEIQVPGSWNVTETGSVFYEQDLYVRRGTQTRLEALETAVNAFIDQVNAQAAANHVDHRIAIVGFSSTGGSYYNTELLSGQNLQQRNMNVVGPMHNDDDGYYYFPDGVNYYGPQYSGTGLGGIDPDNYVNALVDASTPAGVSKLKEASAAVTAYGGTEPEYGLYMAHNVFDQRPTTPEDTTKFEKKDGSLQDRGKVVVFFTDGQPGNQAYSDQIAAANRVVTAANTLKVNDKATIYSVGIFEAGDNQPLTYSKTSEDDAIDKANYQSIINAKDAYGNDKTYFLMRGNSVSYTPHNDTIADYMKCVSSAYPTATNFLAGSIDGGTSSTGRGTEKTDKQYYMYVSDAAGLERAFSSVVSNIDTTTSDVTASSSSVLIDVVNTSDFTLPADFEGSVTAKAVVLNPDLSEGGEDSSITPSITLPKDTDGNYTGAVQVSGFDYSSNYVTTGRTGRKLVVEIKGLTPAQAGEIRSNTDAKIVKSSTDNTAFVTLTESPKDTVGSKTYVIDYNAKMKIAEGAYQLSASKNNANGTFAKTQDEAPYAVTYQLSSGNQASKTAEINKAYTGVDTAMVYGKAYDLTTKAFAADASWNQITTVPASSVYYDDDLTDQAVNVGEGYGYNSGFDANKAKTTFDGSGRIFFTFYGTGIDVYCTTDSESGIVSAAVYEVGETEYNGQTIPVGAKVQGPISVRNYSGDAVRYNTPTVSFRDLTANSYTIMLSANEAAKIKIDGVRVYNPVEAGTAAATELSNTPEADALYVNLHSLLLNGEKDSFSVTKPADMNDDFDKDTISGVLFVDDAANLVTESHWYKNEGETEDTWHDETQPVYQTQFDAYETNSPNNEIYLAAKSTVTNEEDGTTTDKTQAITFQVNTTKAPVGSTIYIGLSAPDNGSGSGSVTVTGRTNPETGELDPLPVTSVMDMYYPIKVPANGVITIANVGDSLIAITNLKITHVPDAKGINAMPAADKKLAMRAFFMPVTTETVELAANSLEPVTDVPETPDTPDVPDTPDTPDTPDEPEDPKPGWNDGQNTVQAILKQLFQLLLKGIGGLFSGLGNW